MSKVIAYAEILYRYDEFKCSNVEFLGSRMKLLALIRISNLYLLNVEEHVEDFRGCGELEREKLYMASPLGVNPGVLKVC